MNFEVKLPIFEGPFDLLLFFIERDELDIYDIPIFKITNDFLLYIKQLEKFNLEIASEFILVAASLMRIKAKMLLPRPVLDATGQEIDPREELVKHLLEYKRFKDVAQTLAQWEETELQKEKRGNVLAELKSLAALSNVEAELQDIDLYKLLRVYDKVMKKYALEQMNPVHQVAQYPFTIEGQKKFILSLLLENERIAFEAIIEFAPQKIALVYNFLAILELLQLNEISIIIGLGYNNFWLTLYNEAAPVQDETTVAATIF